MLAKKNNIIGEKLTPPFQTRRIALVAVIAWTSAIALSFAWNFAHLRVQVREMARVQARDMFLKDRIFRQWNAQHGGVYVPVTADTPPNPHLAVPEREIVTPSGRVLTLVNPAYMIRQVHELAWRDHGLYSHITSLKPIRPGNAADPWERQKLPILETGSAELSSVEEFNGTAHLRLIRPLITERRCLACHAAQGYREGDIRGAISVAVPLAGFDAFFRAEIVPIALGHAGLWALGLGFLFFGITGMVRNERARIDLYLSLQASEERYRTVADFTYDWEYWYDENNVFQYLSPSCERITGHPPRAFIDDPGLMLAIVHPEDRERMSLHFTEQEKTGQPREMEYRIITRGGEERWISHVCQPVHDSAGRYRGRRASNRDITDRRSALKSLSQSEERYRQHFEHSTDIVFTIDDRRCLQDISPSVERLLGYTPSELIGAGAGNPVLGEVIERLTEGGTQDHTVILHDRTGAGRVFDIKCSTATGTEGQEYVYGIARDVTERTRAEELTRSSLQEKEILLREIHHRVKNNMQIISSLLNLQQQYITDDRLRAIFMDSQHRIRAMAMIHENLYRSSDLSNINFNEYARNLMTAILQNYTQKRIDVKMAIDAVLLDIDSAMPCGLIINELVTNAIKHAFEGNGNPQISVIFRVLSGTGEYRLEVGDNGCGLPQGMGSEKSTTLGLTLVMVLVRQLRGTLSIEHNPGARFSITFPNRSIAGNGNNGASTAP